jgi:ribonuclease E
MTKRMLIDATHAEETRVVVLDGSRLEEFDVETSAKQHLKGNIYLAKVVRVEPSLQAAFVEYGGGRHGFLAFGEIHPDYYQIPVADRQRLLDMQAEDARREEEEEERAAALAEARARATPPLPAETLPAEILPAEILPAEILPAEPEDATPADVAAADIAHDPDAPPAPTESAPTAPTAPTGADVTDASPPPEAAQPLAIASIAVSAPPAEAPPAEAPATETPASEAEAPPYAAAGADDTFHPDPGDEFPADPGDDPAEESDGAEPLPPPELIGGDATEEPSERRIPPRFLRNYKIQEVIRRRQILLVQVVKEERGTKGAALTTYISLAGRYCVLMPNSPRGGGISRKITSANDRRRLKEVIAELDLPRGMGLIVRTAGANRPKPEIKRDCEYLLRLWDDIREHTLRSVAPALIYEEANLIKRAIRDVYSRDVDEVLVDGEEGWRAARDFMRMLMPSHEQKVQLWRDGGQPLFSRYGVEAQLDAMLSPTVQLRSGGYLVINQTEALVAIDVNSGRSTRERNIEETALRTNLEAADEVARQLRMRDLAGLIVIDFIDMENRRHNAMVERRLKEALKNDRARIQVGSISHFGLLEMSRQRLRPSLAETAFVTCPHCNGTGHVRGTESAALHVLRHVEEEGAKRRAGEIVVHVAGAIAMYILNNKRRRLAEIEARHGMRVVFAADDSLIAPSMRIERVRGPQASEAPAPVVPAAPPALAPDDARAEDIFPDAAPQAAILATTLATEAGEDRSAEEAEAGGEESLGEIHGEEGTETPAEAEARRRRRRRRRRGGRREDGALAEETAAAGEAEDDIAAVLAKNIEGVPEHADLGMAEPPAVAASASGPAGAAGTHAEGDGAADHAGRRRGRRGGRRRRREDDENLAAVAQPGAEQPEIPSWTGPTPADPFGGREFDIFDALERAERAAEAQASARPDADAAPRLLARPVAVPQAEAVTEPPRDAEAPLAPAAATPAPATPPIAEPVAAEPPPAEAAPAAEPVAEAPIPAQPVPAQPIPAQPIAAEPVLAEALAAGSARPEPLAPPEPERERPGPVIKPIVIGVDDLADAPKKRGWWKR